jgi:hypothetical protein
MLVTQLLTEKVAAHAGYIPRMFIMTSHLFTKKNINNNNKRNTTRLID